MTPETDTGKQDRRSTKKMQSKRPNSEIDTNRASIGTMLPVGSTSINNSPEPDLEKNLSNCCKGGHPPEEVLYWEFGPVELKCQT